MIVTLHTAKGGEGKTTSATNLAAGFARAGQLGVASRDLRTLLVPIDAQGCAARALGIAREEVEPSLAPAIAGEIPIEDAIRPSYLPNLDIITCGRSFKNVMRRMHLDPHGNQRLRMLLDPLRAAYDIIVVDCAPAIGLPFEMAMYATDAYVVPLTLDFLGLEGVQTMFEELQEEWEAHSFTCQMLGMAIMKADYRLNRQVEREAELRDFYGAAVFNAVVRINTTVEEAQARGRSVIDFAPNSRGAQGYIALAQEIVARAVKRGLLPPEFQTAGTGTLPPLPPLVALNP